MRTRTGPGERFYFRRQTSRAFECVGESEGQNFLKGSRHEKTARSRRESPRWATRPCHSSGHSTGPSTAESGWQDPLPARTDTMAAVAQPGAIIPSPILNYRDWLRPGPGSEVPDLPGGRQPKQRTCPIPPRGQLDDTNRMAQPLFPGMRPPPGRTRSARKSWSASRLNQLRKEIDTDHAARRSSILDRLKRGAAIEPGAGERRAGKRTIANRLSPISESCSAMSLFSVCDKCSR